MAMSESDKEYVVDVLTRLLIKTDFYEKTNQKEIYIRKTQLYRDLIKMFKELL